MTSAPYAATAEAEAPAVELREVSKSFGGTTVLRNVSFQVRQGEFLTLLGPSGCGKTTSLRILAGFEQASTGDVRLNGRAVTDLPPWRRDIGVVFQSYALFPYLTAADNVAFGLKMRRMGRAEIARRVSAALDQVGLSGLGARYPRHLSGGQRQRVALARALVIEPQLLLLDEPLSNLDAKLRHEMRYELKRIQRESGVTTVFVTHDQEEAFSLSDRIVLMKSGEIKQAARPQELWEHPASTFVADFIGVENLIPATVTAGPGRPGVRLSESLTLFPENVPWREGSEVILGLRAGDVRMVPRGEGAIPARIIDVEYRGKERLFRLAAEAIAQPVLATAPSSQAFDTETGLVFPENRMLVLADDR